MGLPSWLRRVVRANAANIGVGLLVAVTVAVVLFADRGSPATRQQVHAPIRVQLLPAVVHVTCPQPDTPSAACAVIRVAVPGRRPR